ncbi:MAG: hypothetical protein ACOYNL_00320 [Rickettsiales bacterium]
MASVVSVLFLLLCPSVIGAICLSITVTIIICYLLNLMAGSRAALAAVVIISLHPAGIHLWSTAAERVLAVVAGCVVALLLTFVFHRTLPLHGIATADKHNE